MSDKARRVLAVWASLTPKERKDAVKLINEYQSADEQRKKEISLESLEESRTINKSTSINFGPLDGGCPYCGK